MCTECFDSSKTLPFRLKVLSCLLVDSFSGKRISLESFLLFLRLCEVQSRFIFRLLTHGNVWQRRQLLSKTDIQTVSCKNLTISLHGFSKHRLNFCFNLSMKNLFGKLQRHPKEIVSMLSEMETMNFFLRKKTLYTPSRSAFIALKRAAKILRRASCIHTEVFRFVMSINNRTMKRSKK